MRTKSPYRQEVVHGTPIYALDHVLIPVARIASLTHHRATIDSHKIEGTGAGLVRVQPLHVIDVREGGNRILPVKDVTAEVIGHMALAAAIISLVSLILIVANHRARARR